MNPAVPNSTSRQPDIKTATPARPRSTRAGIPLSGRSRATNEARRVLAQLELPENPPVMIADILCLFPLVRVEQREMEDEVSGMLLVQSGRGTIVVNRTHHPNRKRFTIAHELGHFLLHPTKGTMEVPSVWIDEAPILFRDSRSSDGVDLQEVEANAFAAELLMPEPMLKVCLRTHPFGLEDENALKNMAELFRVSQMALTVRLSCLGFLNL